MTDKDHEELVDLLLELKGMVVLSGYKNQIYTLLEKRGWERIDFRVCSFMPGGTRLTGLKGPGVLLKRQARIESVWLNPAARKRYEMMRGKANARK